MGENDGGVVGVGDDRKAMESRVECNLIDARVGVVDMELLLLLFAPLLTAIEP
jgi:hypothetical protein